MLNNVSITQRDIENEFGGQALPLILIGDREGLKRLYVEMTATACMEDEQAALAMRQALREELHQFSKRVRRGIFADL